MMNKYERKLAWCAFVAYLSAPAIAHSSQWSYSDEPLWLKGAVQHNLMYVLDDSNSMDWETIFDTSAGGRLSVGSDGLFTDADGNFNASGDRYSYLFPSGLMSGANWDASTYKGEKRTGGRAIPPVPAFAFTRSADYNGSYYDPEVEYLPWPAYTRTGYTASYEVPDPDSPVLLEPAPAFAGNAGYAFDLFSNFDISAVPTPTAANPGLTVDKSGDSHWKFYVDENMPCTETNASCAEGHYDYDYYPATYYVTDTTLGEFWYHGPTNGGITPAPVALNCSNTPHPLVYKGFVTDKNRFKTGSNPSDAVIDFVIAPDGSCMKEYKIPATDSDVEFYKSATVTRTVAEERRNFATWFQYYRRRHHAMRGAVASSLEDINDVNVALHWINKMPTSPDGVRMIDWNAANDVNSVLDAHYGHLDLTGQTPLRAALYGAGEYYQAHATNGADQIVTPITSECQRNYTLLFTDGFNTHKVDGTKTNGGADTYDGQIINNIGDATATVGNADSAAEQPFTDGIANVSNTLGDIAYHYYENFQHSDGTVFSNGKLQTAEACNDANPDGWLDCNANLHMTTYTVGLGLDGTIFGQTVGGVTYNSVQDMHENPINWPNIDTGAREQQMDDLYHAAVNGRGEIYSAKSVAELSDAMGDALTDITSSIGSGSGVTFNTSSLEATDGTSIYTTIFNSTKWSGNVNANKLQGTNDDLGDNDDTNDLKAGDVLDGVWALDDGTKAGAAEILDARKLDEDDRTIFTTDGSKGTLFEWDSLTTAQKNDLRMEPGDAHNTPTGSDDDAKARLAWLRGDNSDDSLRSRASRLGDIIHSSPVYVGAPAGYWPDDYSEFGYEGTGPDYTDSNLYSDFRNKYKSGGANERHPMIYVGANDGMLHGFDGRNDATNGGREVMAYVPSEVYSTQREAGLHYLTDPSYKHTYYVDAAPVVQDVFIQKDSTKVAGNDDSLRDWVTMLVGGLRGGGKGLFALDVTDPDNFSGTDASAESTLLWEFNSATAPEAADRLGYRISTPSIVKMNNDKWAVVFGNGYQSTDGEALVFIVFIEQGLDGTWTNVTDYRVLETDGTTGNGMSGIVAADLNGDYVADRIYGGDLLGNMWAFDVSSDQAHKWDVAYRKTSGNPKVALPLFTAEDSAGNPQPITGAPSLAINTEDESNASPNVLVTFGTGKYLENGDIVDGSEQSYYTIWDIGTDELKRDGLVERTLSQTGDALSLSGDLDDDGNIQNPWGSSTYGWFFDFTPNSQANGERLTQKPRLVSDKDIGPVAIFSTMIPDPSECSGGGSSVLYALPLLTGLNPTKPILDIDGDGDIDADDMGVGVAKDGLVNDPNRLGKNIYGSKGDSDEIDKTATDIQSGSEREGRLGWYELIDE